MAAQPRGKHNELVDFDDLNDFDVDLDLVVDDNNNDRRSAAPADWQRRTGDSAREHLRERIDAQRSGDAAGRRHGCTRG